jgi:predicted kinase
MPPCLIQLWGAQAAGKTAVARSLVSGFHERTGLILPHLSTDEIGRAVLGPVHIGPSRGVLYDAILLMAERFVEIGWSALLDATYLEPARRAEVRTLAARLGTPLRSVHVHCSLPSRLERNRLRPGVGCVPDDVIERSHERAAAARDEADVAIDTDVTLPQDAARDILDWLERSSATE